jgi:hypothetical protein
MAGKVVELPGMPGTLDIYARAVRSALPVVGASGDSAPDTTLTLSGVKVDPDNLAAYDRVTGLRFGDTLPLTYPFTLVFPIVMKLMVSDGFPFPAIGSVHAENVIEQFRPISVSEPLDVSVHAENLREHRKGLLIDVVSEIRVGRELVWRQTSSFLRQQKTSLSGQGRPEDDQQVRRGVGRSQPDSRVDVGRQGLRLPEDHRARHVECGRRARLRGGPDSRGRHLQRALRQAHPVAGHTERLRRPCG